MCRHTPSCDEELADEPDDPVRGIRKYVNDGQFASGSFALTVRAKGYF